MNPRGERRFRRARSSSQCGGAPDARMRSVAPPGFNGQGAQKVALGCRPVHQGIAGFIAEVPSCAHCEGLGLDLEKDAADGADRPIEACALRRLEIGETTCGPRFEMPLEKAPLRSSFRLEAAGG